MTNLSPYYREFTPPNVLASLVDACWCFSTPDAATQSSEFIQYRVLPDGCMDLIFQYERSLNGGINNPQLTIYGSTDRFSLFDIKPATEAIGIHQKYRHEFYDFRTQCPVCAP